ncbi:hypothetical protein [Eubacterium sp.]|uniref:hypothetical protein n=1 Tax=Eubacterium sp. TaxID=142586 RepID=UPI0039928C01
MNKLNELNKITTPDEWINSTNEFVKVHSGNTNTKTKRIFLPRLAIITIMIVCIAGTIGVAATNWESFGDWFQQKLGMQNTGTHNKEKSGTPDCSVTKLSLPKGTDILENGFVIAYSDTKKEKVYTLKNSKFQELNNRQHFKKSIKHNGRIYPVEFDSYQNDYYIYITNSTWKGFKSVQISPNHRYILFNAYREFGNYDSKLEWFVQDLQSGKEFSIPNIDGYLHTNEIFFTKTSKVFIRRGSDAKPYPGILDCENGKLTWYELKSDDYTDGNYAGEIFMKLNHNKVTMFNGSINKYYDFPLGNRKVNNIFSDGYLVCLFSNDYTLNSLYLLNSKQWIDLPSQPFSDMEYLENCYTLKEGKQYILQGIKKSKEVYYLLSLK